MQIVYTNGRFEARFSDFQGDLDAVKAAGFKPDTSSGAWVWHTTKIPVLEKLRKNRPVSGIAIDPETFAKYQELSEQFKINDDIKKAAKEFEREQKAKAKEAEYTPGAEEDDLFDADGNLKPHNLPPIPENPNRFKPPVHPGPWCQFCGDPIYFYELPDICIWCEKN